MSEDLRLRSVLWEAFLCLKKPCTPALESKEGFISHLVSLFIKAIDRRWGLTRNLTSFDGLDLPYWTSWIDILVPVGHSRLTASPSQDALWYVCSVADSCRNGSCRWTLYCPQTVIMCINMDVKIHTWSRHILAFDDWLPRIDLASGWKGLYWFRHD